MIRFLYENHRGSPTLTLLNVLGVLNVPNVLHVRHVLHMPMDASLACWALFYNFYHTSRRSFLLVPTSSLSLVPCYKALNRLESRKIHFYRV